MFSYADNISKPKPLPSLQLSFAVAVALVGGCSTRGGTGQQTPEGCLGPPGQSLDGSTGCTRAGLPIPEINMYFDIFVL